jgi:hypothetical protein
MQFRLNDAIIDLSHFDKVVHLLVHDDQIGVVKRNGDTLRLFVCKRVSEPQWSNPWWSDYAQFLVESEEQAKELFHEYARNA